MATDNRINAWIVKWSAVGRSTCTKIEERACWTDSSHCHSVVDCTDCCEVFWINVERRNEIALPLPSEEGERFLCFTLRKNTRNAQSKQH